MTSDERFVVAASSTGTVFEWYDFYLYATLAPFFASLFFPAGNDTAALLSAFATYAAGFLVRPFGAIFFGRIGDLVGRKYTFLITILVMGISTFAVGLLPTYASVGWLAPLLLVGLRLLQGLALGGEYGGAATYVAEHSQHGRRGYATSWIQTTATLGFFLSLLVIGLCRWGMDPAVFKSWGWRIPFLVSAFLLAFSVYIRLKLNESPVFQRMKKEGKGSKSPLTDSFLRYPNNKYVLLALLGATAGQGVVWYTGQFYALFFLTGPLKLDYLPAYGLIAVSLLIGTPLFVFFGGLSDKIGRLKIILAGCLIAALTYHLLFGWLARAVNPDLVAYQEKTQLAVSIDPAQCHFNIFVGPWSTFGDCDKAKDFLTKAGLSFSTENAAAGSKATLSVNGTKVEGFSAFAWSKALIDTGYPQLKPATSTVDVDKAQADQLAALQADKKGADAIKLLSDARMAKDPAAKKIADVANIDSVEAAADGSGAKVTVSEVSSTPADTSKVNWFVAELILVIMVVYVTMVYGPIAAFLVELFPTKIRYTSMSLPYHIGNGWFGGMLPLLATAIVAAYGNIYAGLWYPIVVALMTAAVGFIFLRETKETDIAKT
ncbi:MAG: MFS transporter [Alphaproteobacteria bacterium]|nr:MAG: MFS transporter [Alphaproteobacteria bacterium]